MSGINKRLDSYLIPGKHVHLIGIGGVSMRPLGLVLRGMRMVVTGSDMNATVSTAELMESGIQVHIGHSAKNIEGADCIIRTAAVHNDNPEIAAARAQGIPIFERAEAWGLLMRDYKNAICVSGTHGKTTTTAMLTQIFMQAQRDPTVMIGGYLPLLHAGHRVGGGDTIIMESCEYCDSFLNFYPTIAIINNIEADHLDYFKDLDAVKQSFRKFAGLVPRTGHVIANGDDENTVQALSDLPYISFGIHASNDVHPENLSEDFRSFDVYCFGKLYCHVSMSAYGKHNALNALASAAAAYVMAVDGDAVSSALAAFSGAGRRMEYKGHYHGADIFDDYAHHPGELHALIDSVRHMGYKRIILVFQPHTYTRTSALFNDFVRELCRVDIALIAEIYAARERNTIGITSRDLTREIPNSLCFEAFPEISAYLSSILTDGDILLTVGAGDIYEVGEALLKSGKNES